MAPQTTTYVTVDDLEHRGERPYDESDPSKILHPNGTRLVCGDRALVAALVRASLATSLRPARPLSRGDEPLG